MTYRYRGDKRNRERFPRSHGRELGWISLHHHTGYDEDRKRSMLDLRRWRRLASCMYRSSSYHPRRHTLD